MRTKETQRRIGRFRIPIYFIENEYSNAVRLLEGMVVLSAEIRYDVNAVEYMAFHHSFALTPMYHEAPWYEFSFADDKKTVVWKPRQY